MTKLAKTEDQAFMNDLHIKQLRRGVQENFLELARLLKESRDERYFERLDYSTFESYIASPELSFERRTVYRLFAIYEGFFVE